MKANFQLQKSRRVAVLGTSALVAGAVSLMSGVAVSTPSFGADRLSVCAIVPTTEIEYFATLLNEYKKAGAARNIDVNTIDSQSNPAREASAIEDCVSKKVAAIVASVIDPATSKASAEAAMKAGIPFILQGQEPTDVDWATGNVGYSEADMGRLAGEEVADCLNKKYPAATVIKVGACGMPQWPSTVRRIQASKIAVEKNTNRKIQWVFEQECVTREKGDAAVSAALQANPDLRAVVSINDGGDIGALAAFEAAGVKTAELCIAGPNNDLEVRQYVADGSIYGTVDLNHQGIAEKAMDLVEQVHAGKTIPKMTYVDMIKVSKDNVSNWPVK
jgi:ribose transport system substrate-binding protein